MNECNQDAEVDISVDVSNDDSDSGNRIFGSVDEVLTCDRNVVTVICEETQRNF